MTFRERLLTGECSPETLIVIVDLLEKLGLEENLEAYKALGFPSIELDIWRNHGTEYFINYLRQLCDDTIPTGRSTYVVCLDAAWVRNAEIVETKDIKGPDVDPDYIYSKEAVWNAIEYNAFIDIVIADSDKEARKIAASNSGHDARCLFAIPVRFIL